MLGTRLVLKKNPVAEDVKGGLQSKNLGKSFNLKVN
jgi:hypothetical protein